MSEERLRILHVAPYYGPAWAYGGSVYVVTELARRQAAHGHTVMVATTDALDARRRMPSGRHLIDGVTVYRFPNLSNALAWRRIFLPLGLGRGVASLLPAVDVVHFHEVRSLLNALVLPALLRMGVPYVVTAHGSLPAELGRVAAKRLYDVLIGHRLLSHACRLHALTEMERDQYAALGLPLERITLIPNGIDPMAFDFEVDAAAFRQHYGIPENAPLIGFVGRLNRIKGLDFLIEAFAEVRRHRPDAMLLLAGPDDGAQSTLEAQAMRLGLAAAVRFTGMVEGEKAKAAAYRASTVYVLPSRYETFPTTVLEALLNAVPCILTERCGLAAPLAEANAVQVAPFGDVAVLAATILRFLDSPAEAHAQAKRGRRYVIKHFDWQTVTDRWIQTYRECMR